MKLDQALSEVEFIRARIGGADRAMCFRWATTLSVGLIAVFAGMLQSRFAPQPIERPMEYFVYWSAIAMIAVVLSGGEIVQRYLFQSTDLQRLQTKLALQDFAPAVVVGGSVSLFLVCCSPGFAPLLPAFWMACFSLGMFSLRGRLPEAIWGAIFFAMAAIVAVRSINSPYILSGWLMGGSFGIGHFILASLLYANTRGKPNG